MYAIETHQIGKQYKSGVEALKDITITVKQGEIYCLLGQNGAGKSTLINILSTYFQATSGSIKILNEELKHTTINVIRAQLATVAQQLSVDTHLSLKENMLFQAKLYNVPKKNALLKMEELISSFNLEKYVDYPISSFSGGIKRRLDIALNLMSNPKILFLDEPTVGMDVQSRKEMWKMIQHIRDILNTTVFLTTHYLEEAEQLSDTVCIMKEGRIIIQSNIEKIKTYFHDEIIAIDFASSKEAKMVYPFLKEKLNKHCSRISLDAHHILLLKNTEYDLNYFIHWIADHNVNISGIYIVQPTLEDVFLRIIEREGGDTYENNPNT